MSCLSRPKDRANGHRSLRRGLSASQQIQASLFERAAESLHLGVGRFRDEVGCVMNALETFHTGFSARKCGIMLRKGLGDENEHRFEAQM